jgi:hypothetical protein
MMEREHGDHGRHGAGGLGELDARLDHDGARLRATRPGVIEYTTAV